MIGAQGPYYLVKRHHSPHYQKEEDIHEIRLLAARLYRRNATYPAYAKYRLGYGGMWVKAE
ncbi:MAG: hypothetical protein ACPLRW_04225 [Moorellales bacterium]